MTDERSFPLTELQEAYLVGISQLIELGGFKPHFYLEFDVVGLPEERTEDVVNQLIARHEQLRTVVDGGVGQRVLDGVPRLQVPVFDLSGHGPTEQRAALARTRERMLTDGHNPAHWPLFHVAVSLLRARRARVHIGMSLLLLDAHSTWQVLTEARELYRNPEKTLPPIGLTFRRWRRSWEDRRGHDAYQEQWRYWADRLDTLPEAPVLPLAGPLSDLGPARLTRRTCTLTGPQWHRLSSAVRRERIMPASALAHVFAESIGAWAASPTFCLNVLHSGWRGRHPEWAGVVGQLGATLPIEVDLSDGDFWHRGRRMQRQLWRDLEHSDITAVQIMREVAARRGWSTRPALPYVFNGMLGAGPREPVPWRRPAGMIVESGLRTPHVLVDNQVLDAPGGGITCVWDVVDEAFPPGLPDVMFDAYRELLHTIAAPGAAGTPPWIGPATHLGRVAAVNDTSAALPNGRLEEGFLRQAAHDPEAVALVTAGHTMTYGELESASRAVAHWLLDQDIGRGDVVPVVMVKGWEQVVAVLGVLRAGAAYCPIDAALPAERIRHLVRRCAARTILATSHHHVRWPAEAVRVLEVDRPPAAPGALAISVSEATDLAYVIYTSGSTGEPKGVMIEHRSARNTIEDINDRIALTPTDRVFGISSLSFDLSVWDVFGTLSAGAVLVLPDATTAPAPVEWAAAAARHGVTVWNSVPALAAMLVEVTEHRPELGRPVLRVVMLSGDWIPPTLPDRLRRLSKQARIIALGGATEAAIWSNSFEITEVDPGWRSIPYGTPLRNQTMRVLDSRLEPRPPWATGRIYIGGIGLARGYLGDERGTAERFIQHPHTGERLYWTGDLGRYWPDGTIEFLGREDRQVKVLGFRVEPGEVEAALRGCPGVAECAVTTDTSPDGQRRLVALVIPDSGAPQLDETRIRAYLRGRLPHYMVPGRVHIVGQLPLTANGKVDVAGALATLRAGAPASAGAEPAPDGGTPSPLLEQVCLLWSELLGVPEISPDSDFFALGGNSLLALRLIHRIRDDLNIDMPFGDIFEVPTARALVARLNGGSVLAGSAIQLKPGEGAGLFLLHPVGGAVGCYADLAHAWPGPVHAFQSPGLTGRADDATAPDLETLSAGYRDEILRLSPHGPYLLGGWSMGGVLAHEVGRQLATRGHRPCVFMIDSEVPDGQVADGEHARHVAFLTDLAGGRLPDRAAAAIRAADPADLVAIATGASADHGLLPRQMATAGYQRLLAVHGSNHELLARYRPEHTIAPTLLFVATAQRRQDPARAWRAVCSDLEVQRWALDHYEIASGTHARAIVDRVTRWTAALRERGDHGSGPPTVPR